MMGLNSNIIPLVFRLRFEWDNLSRNVLAYLALYTCAIRGNTSFSIFISNKTYISIRTLMNYEQAQGRCRKCLPCVDVTLTIYPCIYVFLGKNSISSKTICGFY